MNHTPFEPAFPAPESPRARAAGTAAASATLDAPLYAVEFQLRDPEGAIFDGGIETHQPIFLDPATRQFTPGSFTTGRITLINSIDRFYWGTLAEGWVSLHGPEGDCWGRIDTRGHIVLMSPQGEIRGKISHSPSA